MDLQAHGSNDDYSISEAWMRTYMKESAASEAGASSASTTLATAGEGATQASVGSAASGAENGGNLLNDEGIRAQASEDMYFAQTGDVNARSMLVQGTTLCDDMH